jgi:hypothetical protein
MLSLGPWVWWAWRQGAAAEGVAEVPSLCLLRVLNVRRWEGGGQNGPKWRRRRPQAHPGGTWAPSPCEEHTCGPKNEILVLPSFQTQSWLETVKIYRDVVVLGALCEGITARILRTIGEIVEASYGGDVDACQPPNFADCDMRLQFEFRFDFKSSHQSNRPSAATAAGSLSHYLRQSQCAN